MRRSLVVLLLGSGAPLGALGPGAIAPPRRAPLFGRLFKGLGLFNRTSSSSITPAGCVDSEAQCKEWAEQGECKVNPTFMHGACAKSCGMCASVVNPSPARRKGCVDEDGYGCPDRAASGECDSDKGEMLYRCPLSCHVCNYQALLREALGCEDTNQNCAMWAQSGECKANPNYMMENCPVSCTACEAKRKSCDRPPETPPTVRKGDINETMVRILRDFPQFAPKALSWPGGPKGPKAPWCACACAHVHARMCMRMCMRMCTCKGPKGPLVRLHSTACACACACACARARARDIVSTHSVAWHGMCITYP